MSERPLRILLFLYHSGYLRHYGEPVRLLARDGHVVHLAFTQVEKDAGDRRLAERLAAEFPNVTFGEAPTRAYLDGWRRTSTLVRAFTDLARYLDPRYEDAPALRARMAKKIKRQIFSGRADPLSSALLARIVDRLATDTDQRWGRRLLRFLAAAELAIPTSGRIDRHLRDFGPDAVLVSPLVEYASNQVDYLKSARRLGIPTCACIASWDNLTNKGLLRFQPDRVLIWNELQRRELEEMHGIPGDRAVVTGAQKFDAWFERRPTRTAAELASEVGLDPDAPFVLYVCSSWFIAPDEVSFVRRWIEGLRQSGEPELSRLGVIVRPHPQNFAQWQDVDLGGLGNAVVWPRTGAQPDDDSSRADFFDSIHHSVGVVGVNTSAMIDAAIVGKNVLTVLDPAFAATQEGTLHFHYLLRENGGFLNIARDLDEHRRQLAAILAGGVDEAERVREFVRSFVRPHGLDVPVAPIVAREIERLARSTVPEARARTAVSTRLLRLLLLPSAALATATLVVGALLERLPTGNARRRREERRTAVS